MHTLPPLKAALGETMGMLFEVKGHETVYLAGDTIWRQEVDSVPLLENWNTPEYRDLLHSGFI